MRTRYVAECFWSGIQDRDLHELDQRINRSGQGTSVRYLGWLRVLDDEVLLVLFEGPIGTVRRVVEQAQVPFERLLQVSCHFTDQEETE